MITELENLPDISFIDDMTLTDVQALMVEDFQTKYEELTGSTYTMMRADPVSLLLYAAAVQIFQAMLYVDRAGKMDLLKYSEGDFLDHLAALKGITRRPAASATVTMRFTLSDVRPSTVAIPQGTRVSNGSLYYATTEYAEIPPGEAVVSVLATCMTAGVAGDGPEVNTITTLVDPIPYVDAVTNTDVPAGGTDIESDDDLRGRVFLAPSKYSTAGSASAYIYWVKEYSTDIIDVVIEKPETYQVNIYFITTGGELPTQSQIDGLQDWMENEDIKPVTDDVVVMAPAVETFDITLTYYIGRSDVSKVATIQSAVSSAADEYVDWQQTVIGRDINPDRLVNLLITAGVKRVELTDPVFTAIPETSIAQVGTVTVTYGGIEDD
jgi:phage-related baseplate assembly protein